jgi:hypothetical protein
MLFKPPLVSATAPGAAAIASVVAIRLFAAASHFSFDVER